MTDVLLINTACEKSSTNPRWAGQAGERSTTPKIYPAHARHCPLFSNHLKLDSHEDGMSWACSLGCGYLSCQWMMKLHSTGLHAGIIYYSDELILIIHSQPGLLLQNKSKALAKLYSSGQSITDSCGCGVLSCCDQTVQKHCCQSHFCCSCRRVVCLDVANLLN